VDECTFQVGKTYRTLIRRPLHSYLFAPEYVMPKYSISRRRVNVFGIIDSTGLGPLIR
jgi:hypothetical protein